MEKNDFVINGFQTYALIIIIIIIIITKTTIIIIIIKIIMINYVFN